MSKFLIGLLVIGSASVCAGVMHVEDDDMFIDVGEIEKITLVKTLNIKPNTSRTLLGETQCYLEHDSVNYDRSLTAPKSFTEVTVEGERLPYGNDKIIIKFAGLKSANSLYCQNDYTFQSVTVGKMKKYLENYIVLQLASPVEMN